VSRRTFCRSTGCVVAGDAGAGHDVLDDACETQTRLTPNVGPLTAAANARCGLESTLKGRFPSAIARRAEKTRALADGWKSVENRTRSRRTRGRTVRAARGEACMAPCIVLRLVCLAVGEQSHEPVARRVTSARVRRAVSSVARYPVCLRNRSSFRESTQKRRQVFSRSHRKARRLARLASGSRHGRQRQGPCGNECWWRPRRRRSRSRSRRRRRQLATRRRAAT
jgi:hypothetical protein